MDLSELVFFPLKMAMSDPRNQIGKWWGVSRMETEDDMDVTQWYSYVLPDIYFMATFMDLLPGVSWIFHGFTSCFQDFHGFGPQFFQLLAPSPRHHSQHVFAEHPQLVTVPGQLVGGIGDHLGAIHSKSSHPVVKRSMDSMDVMIFMGF